MQKVFSIVLMLVLLLLSFVLDRWISLLGDLAASSMNPWPSLWGGILSSLVYMILVLGFAWLVFLQLERDWWVWVIYILVGALFLFYLPLWSLFPGVRLLGSLHTLLMAGGLRSYVSLSSAAILVTGFLGLLVRIGGKTEADTQPE
jgi:hypothetical protein